MGLLLGLPLRPEPTAFERTLCSTAAPSDRDTTTWVFLKEKPRLLGAGNQASLSVRGNDFQRALHGFGRLRIIR